MKSWVAIGLSALMLILPNFIMWLGDRGRLSTLESTVHELQVDRKDMAAAIVGLNTSMATVIANQKNVIESLNIIKAKVGTP